ncbi:hypothetical protein IPN41_00335 [Candidatus Falkowbacteria bacterium]|nr:MAG: hypothetical protein IPN41_00335 [Candidatus Falkowbacteria bacterium]
MQLLDLLDLHYNQYSKKVLRIISGIIFSWFFLFSIFSFPVQAVELKGLEETARRAGINRAGSNPVEAVTNIIQWVLSFVGVLFLILMIYGGFTWMSSRGNQESIQTAQKIVGSAVIGLVIVLSAYAITLFMGTTFGAT